MEIVGWVVWGLTCLILITQLPLSFHRDPGVGRLATRFSLFILVGLIATAFINVSKLHLIWWLPFTYFLNFILFEWSVNRKVAKSMRELLDHNGKTKGMLNVPNKTLIEDEEFRQAEKQEIELRLERLEQEEKLADAKLDNAVSELIKELSELNGIGDARKIVSSYGKTLEDMGSSSFPVYPTSRLPYSKEDIKRAIEVMFILSSNEEDKVNLLKETYSNLANFIHDEEAAMVSSAWGKTNEKQQRVLDILFRVAEEKAKLLDEFDIYCSQIRSDAMSHSDQEDQDV